MQSIILTRISGRTQVPESEDLASLAAHKSSLDCAWYLSAPHVENSQAPLLKHYEPDTPVAICFRIGWPDELLMVVPLSEMAKTTREKDLICTTLYIISPALRGQKVRSRLYKPDHTYLFRPKGSEDRTITSSDATQEAVTI